MRRSPGQHRRKSPRRAQKSGKIRAAAPRKKQKAPKIKHLGGHDIPIRGIETIKPINTMTPEELTELINSAVNQALAPIREQVNAAVAAKNGTGQPAATGTGTGEGTGTGQQQPEKTPEQKAEEQMSQAVQEYIKNPAGLSEGRKV